MKEAIKDITIKDKQGSKTSKFVLQMYVFVYQRIMDFPQGCFDYETLTTNDLFDSVHKIINVKTHLHHSHITGNIIGYAHDFCNAKVHENKDMLTSIANNFSPFDMFFLLKLIRLSVWETKDINMGAANLTNINYLTIGNVKFIVTMKYYLTSLGKLASTMTEKEKNNAKLLVKQFLMQHQFSSKTWLTLSQSQKTELIKIIVSGKGVIPYEKIDSIKAVQKQPENRIFFQRKNSLAHLKDSLFIKKTMIIQKNCLFYLK